MSKCRIEQDYISRVESFMEFACRNSNNEISMIRCPCVKCKNKRFHEFDEVKYHLIRSGIILSYKCWYYHGENIDNTHGEEINKNVSGLHTSYHNVQ